VADAGNPLQQYGVGASMRRREDDRHLRGRAQFVADIDMRGMQEVVFVRSTHAHAYIGSISVPPEARARVFSAADLPADKTDPGCDTGGWRALAIMAAIGH
jgi:aerobic carbon-monoxide dehydrogenase large subunit